MNKTNYNIVFNDALKKLETNQHFPTLLLHSCCAPCSSSVLSRLVKHFKITLLYYNPNITNFEEYEKRKKEELTLINKINNKNFPYKTKHRIEIINCDFDNKLFFEKVKGFENEKEGGKRCEICFKMRLEKTVQLAKELNFDYFTTTLTVSPYKNSELLNSIGKELEEKFKIQYLYSDFKKEDGYKKSIEFSKMLNLYRQDYCGCVFSLKESLNHKNTK